MNEEHIKTDYADISDAVAVIGMAGRFPGARTIDELWNNVRNGVESIRFFSDEELIAAGISQEELNNPKYVKAKGYTEGSDLFDAHFFNITPREAEFIDPQQRMFLECAWESLENASCVPDKFDGLIGVYAGVGINNYQLNNLIMNPRKCQNITNFQLIIGNDKDYLSSRLSYKLNLRGPSIVIQSACSSSLVAVQLACQGLLNYQCDIALSGGSYLTIPRIAGYEYIEGQIISPDGHCRVFDESASGTVFGEGVGVVTLKRLEDAIEDQDHIYAVIRSIALNNDGSDKVGYTAPSIKGQSDVIKLAHSFAGTEPDAIGYIEAHGTGTLLGDPIEIAGLKEAFASSQRPGKYCAIGSLKANIGHLDVAAGVAGLIKTALAIYHKTIPVSINCSKPNPKLGIEESPFYVNTETKKWTALLDENGKELPLRAGVSSFGVGGTNAHAVLEEIPRIIASPSENRSFILPISAKLPVSLDAYTERLADFIEKNSTISLADTAFTLQLGRQPFEQRRYVICHNHTSAVTHLREQPSVLTGSGTAPKISQKPVFMFSGQGSQYPGMGKDLYQSNTVFRKFIDICAEQAKSILSLDIRDLMFGDKNDPVNGEKLAQTALTQPSLFMIEYALAQAWLSIGITPEALIGHSIGEYTAACLSGVMSIEDALFLVCHRGRLMQSVPPGSMLAVRLPEKEVKDRLTGKLTIGVINTDSMCVVSGEKDDIDDFKKALAKEKIESRLLHTSHAFHSDMMEPILDEFVRVAEKVTFKAPQIPFVSNVSGTWITETDAMNPGYWAQHIRQTVRFAEGITTLFDKDYNVLLEVGPGNTLATIARQQAASRSQIISSIPSQPHPKQNIEGYDFWLSAVGNLWIQNVSIDWKALYGEEQRRRIPLPAYAFDRHRYWIDPDPYYTSFMKTGTTHGVTMSGETDQKTDDKKIEKLHTAQTQEDIIRSIWKEMLGVATIGTNDNFFDLGGDSIWGSQIINRINEQFSTLLPQNAIFNSPTISELSVVVSEAIAESGIESADTTGLISESENILLSFSQQRIWFLHQLAPESPAINLVLSYEITGDLKSDVLEKSINKVLERHDVFRWTVMDIDGEPGIVINSDQKCALEKIDYDNLPQVDAERALAESIREKNIVPYDLQKGPMFRLVLFKLKEKRHVLVLMVHHIIFDGWSNGVFIREVGAYYESLIKVSDTDLPVLSQSYADYARWQRNYFTQHDFSNDREFWKKKLDKMPAAIDMPFDRPRPVLPRNIGRMVEFTFSIELTEKLKTICKRERVTLFSMLLSAFKVLIYRYTGQTDILIGSPVANRTKLDYEKLVGLFINMMVLRSDLKGNPSFSDVLQREMISVGEAISHSEYPFERIVTDLQLPRDLNIHPVYQIMFALQNYDIPTVQSAGISMRNIELDRGASQLDIWLYLWGHDNTLSGTFEYDSELFDEQTIQGMVNHYVIILKSLVDNLDQHIDQIPLMSEKEKNRVLESWNKTTASYPRDKTVVDLFDVQAREFPDKSAVIFGDNKLSYSELNAQSNYLASYLQEQDIGNDSIVGIYLRRSIDMVISVLAIMKAGGAYLPLDPDFPDERIRFMIEDSQLELIITEKSLSDVLPAEKCPLVDIGTVVNEVRDMKNINIDSRAMSDKRAYIIYTSGSTGKPKGVQIPHSALMNFLVSMQREPGMKAEDTLLAVTTLSFDISCLEIFLPLIAGATIKLASSEDIRDGHRLNGLLNSGDVTVMQATPSTWRMMIETGLQSLSGVRVLCGGEAMPRDLAKELLDINAELWNMYGPTETTIWSAVHRITSSHIKPPIGLPITNTELYVFDKHLQPVPVGVPGELFIGGDGLAIGYLNRPELTSKQFIFHSIEGVNEKRIYKTGDLVRRLTDGTIEFLSRLDSQTKLHGHRIELGEIEICLNEHDDVAKSAVIIHEGNNGDKRLVAFVIGKGVEINESEMKEYLRKTLPDYMIPSRFIALEELPLTPNGKVDRNSLKNIETPSVIQSNVEEPPRDEIEKQLVDIWEDVLGVKPVYIRHNFFDIGGDSFIAARLFATILKRMGLTLPLALLFQHPTIADIADSIRSGEYESNWSSLVPIKVEGDEPGLFLVHGAEGNVILYRDLVKYISDGIPVYGLQSKGLSSSDAYDMSIKDMAAHYIREIKTVQPKGPYRLGGYCLGGSIAYEMAQQLKANDDKIELLALIESYNVVTIDYPPPWHVKTIEDTQNLWFHFLNLTSTHGYKDRWDFLLTKVRTERKRISAKFQMLIASLYRRFGVNEKLLYPHIEVTNNNHEAQVKYVPVEYNGNVLILKPKQYFYSAKDPCYGWGNIVSGDIDVVELSVYPHGSLVEPFVKETGEAIMHYLSDNKNSR